MNTERESFEKFYFLHYNGSEPSFQIAESGGAYVYRHVQEAWEFWQASTTALQKRIEELEAEARYMRTAFHVNMLRCYPEKTHDEISREIDAALKAGDVQAPKQCKTITESIDGDVAMSPLVAGQLIAIREALAVNDVNEAYHLLYGIADPNYTSRQPWKRLEEIASAPTDTEGK